MRFNIYKFVLQPFLFIVLVQLFSCSPGACFEQTESLVKATMYDLATLKPLAPDSLTLYGLDRDTNKIYNKALKLLTVEFPLNAGTDSCKFIIRINGITDTLGFIYSSFPHLLSKECGYTFFYTLDTAVHTTNAIDSIHIINKTITTFNEENIRIFY